MKIVFSNLPMKRQLNKFQYAVDGNSAIAYDGEVIFPINSVLAKTLTKGDFVKVVLIKKLDIDGNSDLNAGEYMRELNAINRNIGANIEYKIIDTPFEETKDTHEKLLRILIDCLDNKADIFADITYGPKPLPIVLFSVLNFAEKFFYCNIKNIVYGKVDFVNVSEDRTEPRNPVLFDITPLYYLNAVTNSMECNNSDEAKKMLDTLLSI